MVLKRPLQHKTTGTIYETSELNPKANRTTTTLVRGICVPKERLVGISVRPSLRGRLADYLVSHLADQILDPCDIPVRHIDRPAVGRVPRCRDRTQDLTPRRLPLPSPRDLNRGLPKMVDRRMSQRHDLRGTRRHRNQHPFEEAIFEPHSSVA